MSLSFSSHTLSKGTYCGYSSILIASTLLSSSTSNSAATSSSTRPTFCVTTLEVVQENYDVATKLLTMTGLLQSGYVKAYVDQSISDLGESKYFNPQNSSHQSPIKGGSGGSGGGLVNLLFLDHDKDLYLEDLKSVALDIKVLENGAFVVADNVLIAKIDDYLQWVRNATHPTNLDSEGKIESLTSLGKGEERKEGILFSSSTLFKSRVEYCDDRDVLEYGAESVVDGVEVSCWIGS
jgi:predicted O-methyltransferase YrrM